MASMVSYKQAAGEGQATYLRCMKFLAGSCFIHLVLKLSIVRYVSLVSCLPYDCHDLYLNSRFRSFTDNTLVLLGSLERIANIRPIRLNPSSHIFAATKLVDRPQ